MTSRKVVHVPAPEVGEVATALIAEHHPELTDAPIVYVFRSPASKSQNRTVLGRALRVTGLDAFLTHLAAGTVTPDQLDHQEWTYFVMEIAQPQWEELSFQARRALVDHELCHFYIHPESGELKIRAHDVEEFISIARRHGAWSPDLENLLEACGTRPGASAGTTHRSESCTLQMLTHDQTSRGD